MVVFVGPLAGLGFGAALNAINNRSIWTTKRTQDLGPFQKVSDVCEEYRIKPSTVKGFIGALVMIEMIPIALAIIENLGVTFYKNPSNFTRKMVLQKGIVGAKLLGHSFKNLFLLTVVNFFTVVQSKHYLTQKTYRGLDPSGHAIIVCLNAFLRYRLLSAVQAAGLGSFSHKGMIYLVSAAEGVWGFDTAVNHHSSADIVSGVAIAALAIGCFIAIERGSSKLNEWIKSKNITFDYSVLTRLINRGKALTNSSEVLS